MNNTYKILIVGTGRIGSQIAFQALRLGCKKVYLIGNNNLKLEGLWYDLKECFPESEIIPLYDNPIPEKVNFTFFCVSNLKWESGIGPNTRMRELTYNLGALRNFYQRNNLNFLGLFIIVSNPVDALTHLFFTETKYPLAFGFGLTLDEIRMKNSVTILFPELQDCKIFCLGEHGESVVPVLNDLIKHKIPLAENIYSEIKNKTFSRMGKIIHNISIPFWSPMEVLSQLLNSLFFKETFSLRASIYLNQPYYDVHGVAIGVPCIIKKDEVKVETISATDYEISLFQDSATKLKKQIALLVN